MINTNLIYGQYEQEMKSFDCLKKFEDILNTLKDLDPQWQEWVFQQMAMNILMHKLAQIQNNVRK